MSRKFIYWCGILSPAIYIFMTILGGALRPGYSHMSDTVSELFAPGSPNKPLLDVLSTSTALLTILFGVGVFQFVRESGHDELVGQIGAAVIVIMGVVNVATATVFPQDPWGASPTFAGQMHKILVLGVLAPFSVLSTLLIGIWARRAGVLPGLDVHSFITVGLILVAGGAAGATLGSSVMGLTERLAVLAGQQWTVTLAIRLLLMR